MEIVLNIDSVTCIRCGKCAKVCPAGIFRQEEPAAQIMVEHRENCIVCGHCAAACPTGSVKHSAFPPGKVHSIDRTLLPTPEQVMLLIKSRRSNRAFTDKPVPEKLLDMILEAAHRAPTASNMQQVEFTLVTDPGRLREISAVTIDVFASMARRLGSPLVRPLINRLLPDVGRMLPRFGAMKRSFDEGRDPILRGATAVIFIHTPEKSRFGCQDANLAYQNASLMAESLGVSQFYTGFVCTAIKQDNKKRVNRMFGIDGAIHAGMALGMPQFSYPNFMDKKDISAAKFTRNPPSNQGN